MLSYFEKEGIPAWDTGKWDENDRCGTEISRKETWALQVMEYANGVVPEMPEMMLFFVYCVQ